MGGIERRGILRLFLFLNASPYLITRPLLVARALEASTAPLYSVRTFRPTPPYRILPTTKQIPLEGKASIPDVSLVEETFQFGRLTSGGCESLGVTLVNRGPIPASLHLDLSQHEGFHLERKEASAIPAGGAGTGGDAAADADDPNAGTDRQSRCGFVCEMIRIG